MKTWFNFKAKTDTSAEVTIFDEIGMWGVTAKDFIAGLKAHAGKTITVNINSPGGSVFDALAIYNALRAHGSEITVKVMGVAASAASLIAMAGNKIIMPENTFMMIHNPWAFTAGNADELRDFADTLDTIGSALVKTYVARTGLDEAEVKELLAAETWLTAEEAVAKGFATEMEAALKIAASYDTERFPANIRAIFEAVADEPTEGDPASTEGDPVTDEGEPEGDAPLDSTLADAINAAAVAFGLGEYAAHVALNASVKTIDDAKAFLTNAREVQALCVLAKKPDMAKKMICDGIGLDAARAQITDALAASADEQPTSSVMPSGTDKAVAAGANVWSKIFPQQAAQSKE